MQTFSKLKSLFASTVTTHVNEPMLILGFETDYNTPCVYLYPNQQLVVVAP